MLPDPGICMIGDRLIEKNVVRIAYVIFQMNYCRYYGGY